MTELERSLVALGRELAVPPTPDLAVAVTRRLGRRRWSTRRPLALAVAFALLALLAATLAIPDARSALFRVLRIGGEEIQFVDELPQLDAQPELEYVLGRRVSLAEARREAGFRLLELEEKPDRVFLGQYGTVWFLFGTPERPRLLVAQTPLLRVRHDIFLKKIVPEETSVSVVSVDGAKGYFLDGGPHEVLLVDRQGQIVPESARLARDVLVWSRGGVSYRLEGDLTEESALELARSLR